MYLFTRYLPESAAASFLACFAFSAFSKWVRRISRHFFNSLNSLTPKTLISLQHSRISWVVFGCFLIRDSSIMMTWQLFSTWIGLSWNKKTIIDDNQIKLSLQPSPTHKEAIDMIIILLHGRVVGVVQTFIGCLDRQTFGMTFCVGRTLFQK